MIFACYIEFGLLKNQQYYSELFELNIQCTAVYKQRDDRAVKATVAIGIHPVYEIGCRLN